MGAKDSKNGEHVLKAPLGIAISQAVKTGASPSEILESVMKTLDQQKMISYSSKDDMPLLSPSGRVLVAIMEDPTITQRALSIYLGVTESNVQKSIKSLTDAGIITKTKINSRNVYKINREVVQKHPDITRLYDVIRALNSDKPKKVESQSPF